MTMATTSTTGSVRLRALRRNPHSMVLIVITLVLGTCAAWFVTVTRQSAARPVAMSAECHEAYRGYLAATDPAEADFWAESWMVFGCETGGGYWA